MSTLISVSPWAISKITKSWNCLIQKSTGHSVRSTYITWEHTSPVYEVGTQKRRLLRIRKILWFWFPTFHVSWIYHHIQLLSCFIFLKYKFPINHKELAINWAVVDRNQNDWSYIGDSHEISLPVVSVPGPFHVVVLYPRVLLYSTGSDTTMWLHSCQNEEKSPMASLHGYNQAV